MGANRGGRGHGTVSDRVATERWFLRRGLPHLIEGYSASRDVLTRAAPLLTLVFLVEVLNAPKRSFPLWLDALALAGGFGILLGGWALANRARGRPVLARPVDVGWPEIAVFVVVPPLLPLVFGVQTRSALATLVANAALLGVIYLGASYGVVPTTRWAAERMVGQAFSLLSLLVRALPLLALFVTFLFLTAEVWQSAGTVHGAAYWVVLGLLFAVGTAFVVLRIPRDVAELAAFGSWSDVRRTARADAPTAGIDRPPDLAALPPLSRRQWGNVGLVLLFSQGLQIATVSIMIGGFFLALGVLTVSEATTAAWSGSAHVLASVGFDGRELVMTEELLRVTGFLTAFVGLNFTVYLVTDATYRAEFRDEVVAELRQALAVRALYLARLAAPDAPSRARDHGTRPTTPPATGEPR